MSEGYWTRKLESLEIELPDVAVPVGSYTPAVRSGAYVYTSGQLPLRDGELLGTGKVGGDLGVDEAAGMARQCALNALAAIDDLVGIDAIVRVVKIVGFVASAPGFHSQPAVINGASDVLAEIFGDAGVHARSAVGVSELPLAAPVEVELIVEVEG